MMLPTQLNTDYKSQAGFTLIEIAIVMVIFGLLITMFLAPLSAQRDIQNRAATRQTLYDIQSALYGYAIMNGHLPCPDTDALPDGEENRNAGVCDSHNGILPWNELGIGQVDAWSHYFRYRADATFTDSNTPFTIVNAKNSSGITINDNNGLALVSASSSPAAVVLSHGANGFGATNTTQNAAQNTQAAPTIADELENTDNDVTFVSHPPTADGFDDQLIWISPKVLINRMITAERLP